MSNLSNQLVIAEREDVARCIRRLLSRPVITAASDRETFELICRRREPVTRWFDYYCGWPVVVEPRLGYVRLRKVVAEPGPRRPARRLRSGRAPFDRRRYTLLCAVAAELHTMPATTIGMLADRVRQATSADPDVPTFVTAEHRERRAFVDVIGLLEHWSVLTTLDGTTDAFLESRDAKVLYDVDTELLMRLLAAPQSPSRVAWPHDRGFSGAVGELATEPRYGIPGEEVTPTQAGLAARHRLFRRLVDDPVVYWEDLPDEERRYAATPTGRRFMREAADRAGLVLEEQAEGAMMIDPDSLATDTTFPDDTANAKVAALLLLERLVVADGAGGMSVQQLRADAGTLLARFPHWARSYRGADGTARLVSDALGVLEDFALVRVDGPHVVARPAAYRYRAPVVTARDRPPSRPDGGGLGEAVQLDLVFATEPEGT